MASTTILVAGLWFYLMISHWQLFVASDIKTDSLNKLPLPGIDKKENISWDFLIFAFQWPQSFCNEFLDLKYTNSCIVPAEVNQWTIHGLWPSTNSGKDVFNCNTSYPFNETQIKDLKKDLEHYWPDFLGPDTGELWSHEWNKHGTCAGILPELAGEYNYFKKTMDILKQFNFDRIFQTAKLVPTDVQTYQAENFTLAINKSLGYSPVVSCYTTIHQKVKTTYIVQIEICLDKTFQPMQCPGYILSKGNCGKRVLYYPTITHK